MPAELDPRRTLNKSRLHDLFRIREANPYMFSAEGSEGGRPDDGELLYQSRDTKNLGIGGNFTFAEITGSVSREVSRRLRENHHFQKAVGYVRDLKDNIDLQSRIAGPAALNAVFDVAIFVAEKVGNPSEPKPRTTIDYGHSTRKRIFKGFVYGGTTLGTALACALPAIAPPTPEATGIVLPEPTPAAQVTPTIEALKQGELSGVRNWIDLPTLSTLQGKEFMLQTAEFPAQDGEFEPRLLISRVQRNSQTGQDEKVDLAILDNGKLVSADSADFSVETMFTAQGKDTNFDTDLKTPGIQHDYIRLTRSNNTGEFTIQILVDGEWQTLKSRNPKEMDKILKSVRPPGLAAPVAPTAIPETPTPTLDALRQSKESKTPQPTKTDLKETVDYEGIMQRVAAFKDGSYCPDSNVKEEGFIPDGANGASLGIMNIYEGSGFSGAFMQVCPLAVVVNSTQDFDGQISDKLFMVAGYENKNNEREVTVFVRPQGDLLASKFKNLLPLAFLKQGQNFNFADAKYPPFKTEEGIETFLASLIGKPLVVQVDLNYLMPSANDLQYLADQGVDMSKWLTIINFWIRHLDSNRDLVLNTALPNHVNDINFLSSFQKIVGSGKKPQDISSVDSLKKVLSNEYGMPIFSQVLVSAKHDK